MENIHRIILFLPDVRVPVVLAIVSRHSFCTFGDFSDKILLVNGFSPDVYNLCSQNINLC